MNKSLWLIAPLMAGLLACASALASQEADRAALDAAIQRWTTAVNAGDVDALEATMTEDVEFMDGKTVVTGRDAVIRALRDVPTRGRLATMHRDIGIANLFAWRTAGFTQTTKNGDVNVPGAPLEIWKRVQGTWKLHRQMGGGLIVPTGPLVLTSPNGPVTDQRKN